MVKQALLGQRLIEKGLIDEGQLNQALEYQKKSSEKMRIGEILCKFGFTDEKEILQAVGDQYDVPVADLTRIKPQSEAVEAVPRDTAQMHNIMPLRLRDSRLTVAISDLDLSTIDNLQFILNKEIKPVLAVPDDIEQAIERYYGREESTVDTMLQEFTESEMSFAELTAAEEDENEADDGQDVAIIRLVNLVIEEAVRARASDIHIEPLANRLRIRYRIDGVCSEVESPPKRLQNAMTARLKLMAGMDLAEKRRPQDGRIILKCGGRPIDLRVSNIPCTDGESVVMRILDKESVRVQLTELGFHEDDLGRFQNIISQPNGIFLVTGPTGSGKTTTLYSALNALNRPDTKILTAEDPVEYQISGINQTQVDTSIGRSFPRILRAMLRQAPEIILVGEIRDKDTAEIAMRAALTGHLVFSTLHTNDAPTAIPRLIDLGIKPFMVASSVVASMAQRLVRCICKSCKEPYEYTEDYFRAVGLTPDEAKDMVFYRGTGCSDCNGSGYKGRKGIFELMEMTQELRDMAFEGAQAGELRAKSRAEGMVTLLEDGLRKAQSGMTTLEEVIRVAGSVEMVEE